MASQKNKNSKGLDKVFFLIKSREWKKAYKEAKFRYGISKTDEVRALILQAHWGWIKELFDQKDWEAAKEEATNFMKFGVKLEEIPDDAPMIFLKLNLSDLLPPEKRVEQVSASMKQEMLNEYMLGDHQASNLSESWIKEAETVREVLCLISNGPCGPEVLEPLGAIPVDSPLSDWVLLARGLYCWYEENQTEFPPDWSRLTNQSIPRKIAERFVRLQNPALAEKILKIKEQNHQDDFLWRFYVKGKTSDQMHDKLVQSLRGIQFRRQLIEIIRKFILLSDVKFYFSKKCNFNLSSLVTDFLLIHQEVRERKPDIYDRLCIQIWKELSLNNNKALWKKFVLDTIPLPMDPGGKRSLGLIKYDKWHPNNAQDIFNDFNSFMNNDIDQITELPLYCRNFFKNTTAYNMVCLLEGAMNGYNDLILDLSLIMDHEKQPSELLELFKNQYYKRQHLKTSRDLLRKIIRQDPEYYKYQIKYFDLELAYGKPERALRLGKKILNKFPNLSEFHVRYFNELRKIGKSNERERLIHHMLQIRPKEGIYLYLHITDTMSRLTFFFKRKNWQQVEFALNALEKLKTHELIPDRYSEFLVTLRYLLLLASGQTESATKIEKNHAVGSAQNQTIFYGLAIYYALLWERLDLIPAEKVNFFYDTLAGNINKNIALFFADYFSCSMCHKESPWEFKMSGKNIINTEENRFLTAIYNYLLKGVQDLCEDEDSAVRLSVALFRFKNNNQSYDVTHEIKNVFINIFPKIQQQFSKNPVLRLCAKELSENCIDANGNSVTDKNRYTELVTFWSMIVSDLEATDKYKKYSFLIYYANAKFKRSKEDSKNICSN